MGVWNPKGRLYERTDIEVGGKPALNIIMNHAITSLYL
jgi:hypothetical protein